MIWCSRIKLFQSFFDWDTVGEGEWLWLLSQETGKGRAI
jgi:hypothetical protein